MDFLRHIFRPALGALLVGTALLAQAPTLLSHAQSAVVHFEVLDRYGALVREANGCLVSPEGLVLTSYDAIRGGYSAAVHVAGHESPSLQGVVMVDADRNLVVLKLNDPSLLPSVLLGDAAAVSAGDEVFVVHARTQGDAVIAARVVPAPASAGGFEVQPRTGRPASGDPVFDAMGRFLAVVGGLTSGGAWRVVPVSLARPAFDRSVDQTLRQVTEAHTQETRLLATTVMVPAHKVRSMTLPVAAAWQGGDLELTFTAVGGLTNFIRLRLRQGGRLIYDSHRAATGSFHTVLADTSPLTVEWDNRGSLLLSRHVTTAVVVRQVH